MRILIAEDEDYLQKLYCDILAAKGHQVVGKAFNGLEAVRLYRSLDPPPDCVIMDHRMPLCDGLSATRQTLELDPKARIIFASADQGVVGQALEAGAQAFLAKPFSISELRQAIESPLELVHVYLATREGLPVTSIQRREGGLDPDLFSSMLSAIDDFASHSLSGLSPSSHHLSKLEYGPWTIGVHLAVYFRLILVYQGYSDAFLKLRLKQTVASVEQSYGSRLQAWNGSREGLEGLEAMLKNLGV